MASIAKLSVQLSANTSKFSGGMRSASKSLKSFRSGMVRNIKAVGKFGLILGGLAAGALALATKRQFEFIDATAKLADRVGESTENIQRLRFAASIMGVSADSMDKSLGMLQQRLGEVTMGTGEAKDAIEALGLTIGDLLQMTPAAQFSVIAEAVSRLGTQAERTAVAADLFGRAGRELVGLLGLGAGGIAELADEADRLGITFSRLDAAGVENMNDAMTRLKFLVTGVVQRFAIQIAPLLQTVIDLVVEWGVAFGGVDKVIEAIPGALRSMANAVAGTFHQWEMIFKAAKVTVLHGLAEILSMGTRAIIELVNEANKIPFIDIDLDVRRVLPVIRDLRNNARKAAAEMREALDEGPDLKGINRFFDEMERRATETAEKLRQTALERSMLPVTNPAETAAKAFDDYNDALEQANTGLGEQVDLVKEMNRQMGQAGSGKFRAFTQSFPGSQVQTPAQTFAPRHQATLWQQTRWQRTPWIGTEPGLRTSAGRQGRQEVRDAQISDTNRLLRDILDSGRQPNVAVFAGGV